MAVMTKEEFAQHVKSDTLPMYRLAYSILQNGADGVEISGKDPAQTVFYYEPMKK